MKKKYLRKNLNKNNSKKESKESILDYIKKRPFFLIFFIGLIISIIILISLPREDISEIFISTSYGKVLHDQHVLAIDEYLLEVETQLDEDYESAVEDDYLYSFKEDLLWLRNLENKIFQESKKDFFIKELAFNLALESVLIVNEDSAYDFYMTDYELRIEEAKKEQYFSQNFENNEEIKNLFLGEDAKFEIFIKEYNQIMKDYFDYKSFVMNQSDNIERKFIEANKIFILSDPLTLS
ncbi:MAG TPA: hypothetical protein PKK60_02760 [archaeon]|nr:hypothetical protein [archaeon]